MLSADPAETRRFALRLLTLTLAGQLFLSHTFNQRRLRVLIHTVIGIGVASALFGIARQAVQGDSTGFVLPFLTPKTGYGQFINKNHFAFLMEMPLGLVLGLIVGGGVSRDKLLAHFALVILMWVALILSNSRGGILAALSQMLFLALMFSLKVSPRPLGEQSGAVAWLWRFGRLLTVRVALVVCLVVFVVLSVVWIGSDQLISNFNLASTEFSAPSESRVNVIRRYIWRDTLRLFKDHPVAGSGFGGYWLAITPYHDASGENTPQQAHNDYLELLASGGLIGFALTAWFVRGLIKRARRGLQARNPFQRATCLGALAGMFAVAVHSFVDFGLHITIIALIFTSLIVISIASLEDEASSSKETGEVAS